MHQYYIFINTRTLVWTEAIITQLVFAHSLRIEGKNYGRQLEGQRFNYRITRRRGVSAGGRFPGLRRRKRRLRHCRIVLHWHGGGQTGRGGFEGSLVGRINNLVTTDLGNIVDSRDFFKILLIYVPLQLSVGDLVPALAVGLALVATCVHLMFGQLRASKIIHKNLVDSVPSAPLRWLDVTPTSRIIARVTSDVRAVDDSLPNIIWPLVAIIISMLVRFGAVIIYTPIFFLRCFCGGHRSVDRPDIHCRPASGETPDV